MKCKLFYKEKFIAGALGALSLFLPSVYDALIVIRPTCNFRDSRVIKNYGANQAEYYVELPFNDSYLLALVHLCCVNYNKSLCSYTFYYGGLLIAMCKEVCDINERGIMLGFASVFLFIKCYGSFLVAELSQLCYRGVFRAIALGSTNGLSTHSCTFVLSFGPLIVPVGKIAIGRILNVLGSSIDCYMQLSLSSEFSELLNGTTALDHANRPFNVLTTTSALYVNTKYTKALPSNCSQAWIFYMAYTFNLLVNKAIAISNYVKIDRGMFQEAFEHRFYYTDTLFALIKPIHKTPVPMINMTVSVNLFETGIKVVDLYYVWLFKLDVSLESPCYI